MPFLALHVVCSFLPDLLHVFRRSNHDQVVKLPRLRQPLRVYERKAKQPRLSRCEKELLASLAARLAALSTYLYWLPSSSWHQHRHHGRVSAGAKWWISQSLVGIGGGLVE